MAWTYADFGSFSTDPAARLARLNLHITEVRQEITATVQSDSKSRDANPLVSYLSGLEDRRKELEETASLRSTGNFGRFRPGRRF
jgi:hypothetical protein